MAVTAAFAGILAVVVLIQALMLYADGWRLQWGNVAEWVGAAGALATVGDLGVAWMVNQADKTARTNEDIRREKPLRMPLAT